MSWLFHSSTSSFADEQLSSHLTSLSTLPVNLPTSSTFTIQNHQHQPKPSAKLQNALHDLSSDKPISKDKLLDILKSLSDERHNQQYGYVVESYSDLDKIIEMEVLTRAIMVLWKETLQSFVQGALSLDDDKNWWDFKLGSRSGVMLYLVQTMPHRLYRILPPRSTLSLPSLRAFQFPSRSSLFKPLQSTTAAALSSITSPYILTRQEMLASRNELAQARDEAARRVGQLASQGPQWASEARSASSSISITADINAETSRLYSLLCDVLEVPTMTSAPPSTSKRSRSSNFIPTSIPVIGSAASPQSLLALLTDHLPKAKQNISQTLTTHGRPSAATRLWFPFLFLPPTLYVVVTSLARNKEWMREQVRNAKETVKGFFVQWVWEPLEGIGKTLRGGGEGLGVAPTTVQSDQASLERMVLDLGRDYYHLSGPALDTLAQKVRTGDMEEVLRVYEKEMQSPVKNALMGSLIRTLLIQVQKTKTDLSLSLLSLDHLLRSQQLTFAFVGVAPSVLVLYGVGGWLQRVWRGEKRGKGRRRQYFNGLRSIESILLTSPKHSDEMCERDRGLLIVSVSGLRSWAAGGLSSNGRSAFLDDLRMVEDPSLSRGDKLRVVERIWRCWGIEGKRQV